MVDLKYEVIRKPRIRTATITVFHDNRIVVTVPKYLGTADIKAFIDRKSKWIMSKLRFNIEVREPYQPRQFVDGEAFNYLGKSYRLCVQHGKENKPFLSDSTLCVCIPSSLTEEGQEKLIKSRLIQWYRDRSSIELEDRIGHFKSILGVKVKEVRLRTMKSRWGSCSSSGALTFNWQIIMSPLDILDYVVVHELCHLVHMNHSKEFWGLVESILPDCKARRAKLKIIGNSLAL